ncbi:hypothetical protein CPC08DRAFT_714778 [Agrocybe pediades]|nr:hypothetical protein CPC08DRAFT_714778 [Agrocybe pediades]
MATAPSSTPIFTSSGSTCSAFDSAHPSSPSSLPPSLYFFLSYDLNGYSSIDAAPTMISAGVKGRREDTTIPAPLPPPAFPAIMGYHPTSVVPAGMCSFPENSSASPHITALLSHTPYVDGNGISVKDAVERDCCSCQYLFCVGCRCGRESRFMKEARTWIPVDWRLV